jgi:hypothetical protein
MNIYEKIILGQSLKDFTRLPSAQETIRNLEQQILSQYPLRLLGVNETDGEVYMAEEDREAHVHILGSPGEGKSKFLEYNICQDILNLIRGKSKAGACFIDSTGNGETMKKVLKYCAEWGFEKVCVIDPHHIFHEDYGYVTCINPIDYDAPSEAIEAHVMDTMRVLWQTEDFSRESIISKYAPRIIKAVHSAGMTLVDTECFTIPEYGSQRDSIIGNKELDTTTKLILRRVFRKSSTGNINSPEWSDFQATARRFDPFYHSVMKHMLGSKTGLDFPELISKGWVILVNLYPGGVFEEKHQRLLGTLILNEIIRAFERMPSFKIPYYVYIDEFGHYATRKISNMLDYRRHFGIRMMLAHQGFDQIDDRQVVSAVRRSAKTKVLFYAASKGDRDLMIRDMNYGGELPLEQVSYALGQTKKKEAVVRINKQPPQLIRLVEWPDSKTPDGVLKDFIKKLYTSNPKHYRPRAEVWEEIKTRFAARHQQPGGSLGTAPLRPAPRDNQEQGTDSGAGEQTLPVEPAARDIKLPGQRPGKKGIPPTLLPKSNPDA